MNSVTWRKSSYSASNGGECVEVGSHHGRVLVRDTKDREGPVLRVGSAVWRRFADGVKSGRPLAAILARQLTPVRGALPSGRCPSCSPGPASRGLAQVRYERSAVQLHQGFVCVARCGQRGPGYDKGLPISLSVPGGPVARPNRACSYPLTRSADTRRRLGDQRHHRI